MDLLYKQQKSALQEKRPGNKAPQPSDDAAQSFPERSRSEEDGQVKSKSLRAEQEGKREENYQEASENVKETKKDSRKNVQEVDLNPENGGHVKEKDGKGSEIKKGDDKPITSGQDGESKEQGDGGVAKTKRETEEAKIPGRGGVERRETGKGVNDKEKETSKRSAEVEEEAKHKEEKPCYSEGTSLSSLLARWSKGVGDEEVLMFLNQQPYKHKWERKEGTRKISGTSGMTLGAASPSSSSSADRHTHPRKLKVISNINTSPAGEIRAERKEGGEGASGDIDRVVINLPQLSTRSNSTESKGEGETMVINKEAQEEEEAAEGRGKGYEGVKREVLTYGKIGREDSLISFCEMGSAAEVSNPTTPTTNTCL